MRIFHFLVFTHNDRRLSFLKIFLVLVHINFLFICRWTLNVLVICIDLSGSPLFVFTIKTIFKKKKKKKNQAPIVMKISDTIDISVNSITIHPIVLRHSSHSHMSIPHFFCNFRHSKTGPSPPHIVNLVVRIK